MYKNHFMLPNHLSKHIVSLRHHSWVGLVSWCDRVSQSRPEFNLMLTVYCLYLGIVSCGLVVHRIGSTFPRIHNHTRTTRHAATDQASSRAGPDLPAPNPMDLRDGDLRISAQKRGRSLCLVTITGYSIGLYWARRLG